MPPPPTPDHARQQAQAHLMNPGMGHRMTMAQPRMSDPGAQGTFGFHIKEKETEDSSFMDTE